MTRTPKTRWPILLAALAAGILWLAGRPAIVPAGAQPALRWELFGHDNGRSSIIRIDTATGAATEIGPTGFASGSSGMATAPDTVPGPGGTRYARGTFIGLLRDGADGEDYVVAVDPVTGAATKIVRADRPFSGRGVSFGADGRRLFVFESIGDLSTIDPVTGAVTFVGRVSDGTGRRLSGDSLEWDPDSRTFISLAGSGQSTVLSIDPATGAATALGDLPRLSACTVIRAPGPVPGPGGVALPEGTWMTVNQRTSELVTLDIDVAAGVAAVGTVVGPLGFGSSGFVCGTAFTLPEIPPTPTPEPPTPAPGSDCVCRIVRQRVPRVVIDDALANPGSYYGWRYPLDPGKPPGPNNPPRECLTLSNVGLDYHPLWNKPEWRVGCP